MTHAPEPAWLLPPEKKPILPPPPVHALAALAAIALDNGFGVLEIGNPQALLLTSLGVGGLGLLATLVVQRFLAGDPWGDAAAKGLVMGILAGVPYQVTGTVAGALLLGWAGANHWLRLPPRPEGEIVEADRREAK